MKALFYSCARVAALAGILGCGSMPALAHEQQSDRSKFVDHCLALIDKHDDAAYNCYTDDYVLSGGPENYFAPGRRMIGRAAVRGKMVMGSGDLNSFDEIAMTWTDLAESGDTLVRHLHQDFRGPKNANYAGFTDLPRDMHFPVDVIIVYTFRGGKIASEFFQYDSMGFLLDLGQRDPEKIKKALATMIPMMEQMEKTGSVPENPSSDRSGK